MVGACTGSVGPLQDGGAVPINKNLWSPSFILVIGGIDCCALAALFLLVDVAKLWNGAPFIYAGMNSIVIYFLSETFDDYFPIRVALNPEAGTHAGRLFSNVLGVCMFMCLARWLFLKKIFVNI